VSERAPRTVMTDLGNGFTKVFSRKGACFPSIVGRAESPQFSVGAVDGIRLTADDGQDYFVGDLARRLSVFKSTVIDRSRIGTTFYRILFQAALGQVVRQSSLLRCVLQLPVGWFSDRRAVHSLTGRHIVVVNGRKRTYEVEQVLVLPDGFGALWYALSTGDTDLQRRILEGRVGVIDVGTGTRNLSLYDRLVSVPNASPPGVGLVRLWTAVQREFSNRFHATWELHEIDAAIRAGRLSVNGAWQPVESIVRPLVEAMADELRGDAQTQFGTGQRVDVIILCGGGMIVSPLAETVQALLPNAVLVDKPVMANAIGGYWFGLQDEVWQ
jgi:hypothetical protein